ncbi:MAG: UDP-N-acetylmuramate dehydrogenase [Undibacterium sp.]|nr:UDP-N-acetylmuramate dehydrogenase [Undibacterium sp.]
MTNALDIQTQYPLKNHNSFGIAAKAELFLCVSSLEQLRQVASQACLLPRLVLGGGSNLILSDELPYLVLQMALKGRAIIASDENFTLVEVAAGENWHEFVQWTLAQGLGGLENLSLIPGTVGAAPIQNIGAYGAELQDYFLDLTVFDFATAQMRVMSKEDCQFGYRDSIFKRDTSKDLVITSLRFALPKVWQARLSYGDIAQLLQQRGITRPSAQDVSDTVMTIRQSKLPDPQVLGNAGSFFKNPMVDSPTRERLLQTYPHLVSYVQGEGRYKLAAGWLIEQCGWKGRHSGAVGVYEKQALVLVNLGGATGSDVRRVAQEIQADVWHKFAVALEVEPVFI